MSKNNKNIVIILFPPALLILSLLTTKISIELQQHSYFSIAFYLSIFTQIVKIFFLISCFRFLVFIINKFIKNILLQVAVAFLGVFVFLVVFIFVLIFPGRMVLNASRPIHPEDFIADSSQVDQLTQLSYELIRKKNIFWISNRGDNIVFGIRYKDHNFLYDTEYIPKEYDFTQPLPVEDAEKVSDYPFRSGLHPTDQQVLSRDDYGFCLRGSKCIRKVGFNSVELYEDVNIVRYEIRDFYGWDGGWYYIYYFSPTGILTEEFEYEKKLDNHWYFLKEDRFPGFPE